MKSKLLVSFGILMLAASSITAYGNSLTIETEAPAAEALIASESGYYTPGDSQESATKIFPDRKIYSTYDGGTDSWWSFTTDSAQDTYWITGINNTVGSKNLYGNLYDAYGKHVTPSSYFSGSSLDKEYGYAFNAENSGRAYTTTYDDLDANTTYYLLVTSNGDDIDYSLVITSPPTQIVSAGADIDLEQAAPDDNTFITGTSQDSAKLLSVDTKVYGTYTGGYSWLAFTTNDAAESEYIFTVTNNTVSSKIFTGICMMLTVST